jgi:Glycosyl hydrolases family 25
MSQDDEDTQPQRPGPVSWLPSRPLFADVNRWVRLADPCAYANACSAGCIGVKVSEGENWIGALEARQVVDACLAAGLIVIGYHYGPASPDAFLGAFPPRSGCIPCLDFEFAGAEHSGSAARVAAAERWIAAVGDAWGRFPWFYGRSEWMIAGAPKDTLVSSCPYWGPQYGTHMTPPRGVGRTVAWQYTDGASGPEPRTHAGIELRPDGTTKACDMSALVVPVATLRAMAGLI